MKWTVAHERDGKPSKYAIKSGNWIICKTLTNGVPLFTLWDSGKSAGHFETAEKAKEAAKNDSAR